MLHGRRSHHPGALALGSIGLIACRQPAARVEWSVPRLGDVPVGAWAEYRLLAPGHRFQQVVALVASDAGRMTLETRLREESSPNGPTVITDYVFAAPARFGDKPIDGAVQVDNNEPMTLPPDDTQPGMSLSMPHLEAENLSGLETLNVSAGRYASQRYDVPMTKDRVASIWLSRDAPPSGLVKLQLLSGSDHKEESTVELVRLGAGAHRGIGKAPRPFDSATYMRVMIAAWTVRPASLQAGPRAQGGQ